MQTVVGVAWDGKIIFQSNPAEFTQWLLERGVLLTVRMVEIVILTQ